MNDVHTLLLSAAMVEELEDSRQQYVMYIIHYSIEHIAFSAEYTFFNNNCNFDLIYRYSLSVNLTLSITV